VLSNGSSQALSIKTPFVVEGTCSVFEFSSSLSLHSSVDYMIEILVLRARTLHTRSAIFVISSRLESFGTTADINSRGLKNVPVFELSISVTSGIQ
jgi:hypothetical protein